MIKKVIGFFDKFAFFEVPTYVKKTVDESISDIVAKAEELESIAISHVNEATSISQMIVDLGEQLDRHESESARASKIAGRIKALFE